MGCTHVASTPTGPYSPAEVAPPAAKSPVPTEPATAPQTSLQALTGFRAMLEQALQEGGDAVGEHTPTVLLEGGLFDDNDEERKEGEFTSRD